MTLFSILVYIALAPVTVYIYILIGRVLKLFKMRCKQIIRFSLIGLWLVTLGLIIYNFSYIYIVAIIYFACINLVMELVNLFLKKKWIRNRKAAPASPSSAKSRRAVPAGHKTWDVIYKSGIISLIITATIIGYGFFNAHNVQEVTYSVTSEKISDSYKIAFISDLHLGGTMDAGEFKEYLDIIESKNVDMLILGGDLFDENTLRSDMEKVCEYLGDFKSTYGTYFIYGNHDNRSYLELLGESTDTESYNSRDLRNALEEAKITVLEDEVSIVNDEIVIMGRRDKRDDDRLPLSTVMNLTVTADPEDDDYDDPASAGDLKHLMPEDPYIILADHQPVDTEEKVEAGIDLVLSGHTHGGQVFPLGILNTTLFSNDYNYGYYRFDNTDLIVSSGIGCWGNAIRTDHHCEYVIIDINKT